ncbi:MAG: SocA family protein [Planctomycetes bacterium]|nr:SocA family protein [Planctomycetota bacterium]
MQTSIQFTFQWDKAVAAMVYLISKLGSLDKVKLMKLLYMCDREAFLALGRPVTGDRQFAMPYGPVPSKCLNLINESSPEDRFFRYIHVVDNQISVAKNHPELPSLEPDELQVLDRIIDSYGNIETWALRDLLHKAPEFKEFHQQGTSTLIPYEAMLKHHGSDDQFRHGRPVISAATASHIRCPLPPADADL